MKPLLTILFISLSLSVFAQQLSQSGDTLIASNGMKFYHGLMIKLGTGTLPNGDFKYINTSPTSWIAYAGSVTPTSLGKSFSGISFTVKEIKKYGSQKRGYSYHLVLGGGNIVNYHCDIENAITSGEVIVPDEFKKKQTATIQINQTLSVSDELVKLKKLYSDSILTKEEYEAQKKRLLEKN